MYSIDDLNHFMDSIQEEEKKIRVDRGKRYGSPTDTLGNVAEFGEDGCIISMWECIMRGRNSDIHPIIKALLMVLVDDIKRGFGKPKDIEDMTNWCMDARNYLGYILCMMTRDLGQGEYNIPPSTPQVPRKPQVVAWEDTK